MIRRHAEILYDVFSFVIDHNYVIMFEDTVSLFYIVK